MRISDWSSDLCSSDLRADRPWRGGRPHRLCGRLCERAGTCRRSGGGAMTTVPARGKLMWFALAVTMLTGFVDATGFLAFGRLFLASHDAGRIVAGVALVGDLHFGLFPGRLMLGFLAGVFVQSHPPERIP